MSDEIKENILSPSQWLRILYMIFFAVVCWVLGIVITVLVIGQALFSLITGSDNENLRIFGSSLARYFYQILCFLTYNSNEKPFPFKPFPVPGEGSEEESGTESPESEAIDDEAGDAEESTPHASESDSDDVFADISFTGSGEGGGATKDSEAEREDEGASPEGDDLDGGDSEPKH